jgi:hypothetical protein
MKTCKIYPPETIDEYLTQVLGNILPLQQKLGVADLGQSHTNQRADTYLPTLGRLLDVASID